MNSSRTRALASIGCLLSAVVSAATYQGTPTTFQALLPMLQPGDTLELAAGTYPHFTVADRNGTAAQWITITGPTSGAPAIVQADLGPCCNTVEIRRSSYVAIRHLTVDNRSVQGAFAISASSAPIHHIRIENNRLVFTNAAQQDVGISTKVTTWGWEIRSNRIEQAGTGLYLGNSDGSLPFIDGVIERNLVINTVGYNMQIKHQNAWPAVTGLPTARSRTFIRHNVFIKDGRASPDGDRPNLLVGGWPDTGPGADNGYEVYGNLLFQNPREALFQATGNVSVHDNLFVKSSGPAALVMTNHSGKTMKRSYVYNNTFLTPGTAVSFTSTASVDDLFAGNLLLAGSASTGTATNTSNNLAVPFAMAGQYVRAPMMQLPGLDLYPLAGQATGAPVDLTRVMNDLAALVDFNGTAKGALRFRGAYAGDGVNPGWPLDASLKNVASGGGAAGGGAAGGGSAGGGSAGGGSAGGGSAGGGASGGGAAGGGAAGGSSAGGGSAGGGASAGGDASAGGSAAAGGTAGGSDTLTPPSSGCGCQSTEHALALIVTVLPLLRRKTRRATKASGAQ
ncbi:MAG: hypothetical protein Q8L14_08730 [Myxococcales bacterium]|nr:hypothetical protein [Myxococcales bacterium]